MSALALSLVIIDAHTNRINYVAEHAILGGIASILFFQMCNYGFELVNWVLLSIIPIFIILVWLFSDDENTDEDYECDNCRKPKKTCGCNGDYKTPKLNCPANPIDIGSECGISRYT